MHRGNSVVVLCFARIVLAVLLFVVDGLFADHRYIYDLNVPKGVFLSMEFGLSWCRLKPRNE